VVACYIGPRKLGSDILFHEVGKVIGSDVTTDQKIIDKLTKAWEKAEAVWKKAAKKSLAATGKYRCG
jgi:hypothetical protein